MFSTALNANTVIEWSASAEVNRNSTGLHGRTTLVRKSTQRSKVLAYSCVSYWSGARACCSDPMHAHQFINRIFFSPLLRSFCVLEAGNGSPQALHVLPSTLHYLQTKLFDDVAFLVQQNPGSCLLEHQSAGQHGTTLASTLIVPAGHIALSCKFTSLQQDPAARIYIPYPWRASCSGGYSY